MKTLLLMRHAKSSWKDLFCPDHDRPLSKRGVRAAKTMGKWLAENNLTPDSVLLSSAKRTVQTWETLRPYLKNPPPVDVHKSLYMTNPDYLLARIRNTDKSVKTLLVINHDPTISQLTAALAQPPLPDDCARALQKFQTAAIARFEMGGKWTSLSQSKLKFVQFVKPKDFGPDN